MSSEMTSFFKARSYPIEVVAAGQGRQQKSAFRTHYNIHEAKHLRRNLKKIRMIITYHPKNQEVKKVLLKNFSILADDTRTKDICKTTIRCVYLRDTNLQDILLHKFSLHPEQEQPGTFPCRRFRCWTCKFTG